MLVLSTHVHSRELKRGNDCDFTLRIYCCHMAVCKHADTYVDTVISCVIRFESAVCI